MNNLTYGNHYARPVQTGWPWFKDNDDKDKQQVILIETPGSGNSCFYYSISRCLSNVVQNEEKLKEFLGNKSTGNYYSDVDIYVSSFRRDLSDWMISKSKIYQTNEEAIKYINCVDENNMDNKSMLNYIILNN